MRFRGGEFSTGTTGNFQPELTRAPWGTDIEGAGAQLSDDQQRSRTGHESFEGRISKLGYPLYWAHFIFFSSPS
jgi:hypothetical protein